MKLFRSLPNASDIKNCEAWVYTVARNVALDILNREKKHKPPPSDPDLEIPDRRKVEDEIVCRMDARKKIPKMEEAVRGIKLGWECIYLIWTGKSYTEAAEELGLTFTQFRGRYQRAHEILRKEFGEDYKKYLDCADLNEEEE